MTGKTFLRKRPAKVPYREHTRKYEQHKDIQPHQILFDCDFEEIDNDG